MYPALSGGLEYIYHRPDGIFAHPDCDDRADFAENVEQDALLAFGIIHEHTAEGFVVNIFATQHLTHRLRIEYPHAVGAVRGGDVQRERGVVLRHTVQGLKHTTNISRIS